MTPHQPSLHLPRLRDNTHRALNGVLESAQGSIVGWPMPADAGLLQHFGSWVALQPPGSVMTIHLDTQTSGLDFGVKVSREVSRRGSPPLGTATKDLIEALTASGVRVLLVHNAQFLADDQAATVFFVVNGVYKGCRLVQHSARDLPNTFFRRSYDPAITFEAEQWLVPGLSEQDPVTEVDAEVVRSYLAALFTRHTVDAAGGTPLSAQALQALETFVQVPGNELVAGARQAVVSLATALKRTGTKADALTATLLTSSLAPGTWRWLAREQLKARWG